MFRYVIGGKIENCLERGFIKHCLNYLLITDPMIPHYVQQISPLISYAQHISGNSVKWKKNYPLMYGEIYI